MSAWVFIGAAAFAGAVFEGHFREKLAPDRRRLLVLSNDVRTNYTVGPHLIKVGSEGGCSTEHSTLGIAL